MTPFDILANLKEHEKIRRNNTCGSGVWKTIERYEKGYGAINIREYVRNHSSDNPYYYWIELNHYYKDDIMNYDSHIDVEGLKIRYKMDLDFMSCHCVFMPESFLKTYDNVIFENGQGLLIGDQQPEDTWWSGTPSNTGCSIASKMIADNTLQGDVTVCYVSRTYLTRHGEGDLPNECWGKEVINTNIEYDATNYRNQMQGHLRYARLDIDTLKERIDQDFLLAPSNSHKAVMFTHWNEHKVHINDDFIDDIDKIFISKSKYAEDMH